MEKERNSCRSGRELSWISSFYPGIKAENPWSFDWVERRSNETKRKKVCFKVKEFNWIRIRSTSDWVLFDWIVQTLSQGQKDLRSIGVVSLCYSFLASSLFSSDKTYIFVYFLFYFCFFFFPFVSFLLCSFFFLLSSFFILHESFSWINKKFLFNPFSSIFYLSLSLLLPIINQNHKKN